MKVGVVGCGNISGVYFQRCGEFENIEIAACCDIVEAKAKAAAEKYSVPKTLSFEELLTDTEIDIVLNLTIPHAHYEVGKAVLDAGKHLYNEKPLAIEFERGRELVELAERKGLRIGCAPDTFLGAGLQTCGKLIEDGRIGKPTAATAFMMCRGHESWHPSPEFYYQKGGGPMFDMGPYYLTALIHLLGPVDSVSGMTSKAFKKRTITSEPKKGSEIDVEIPTHIAGLLHFTCGAVATIVTSFDVWHHSMTPIEIYGTEGSMSVPDPNTFGGPVKYAEQNTYQWSEIELTHGYSDNFRGLGLADMAAAVIAGREHRANGKMALHVLEIMHALHTSFELKETVQLSTVCEKPKMMPVRAC